MATFERSAERLATLVRDPLGMRSFVLRCAIAAAVGCAVTAGAGDASASVRSAAGWIAVYHACAGIVALRLRKPAAHARLGSLLPWLDATAVTGVCMAAGPGAEAAWALYLLVVVSAAPRLQGRAYGALCVLVLANAAAVRGLASGSAASVLDGDLLFALAMIGAIGGLSGVISASWRSVERETRALAATDALTGIANRRGFFERLDELCADPCARAGVILMDVDNFKAINDDLGHRRGDEVLAAVASLVNEHVRPGDLVGRYGGEEFIVALPGSSIRQARLIAERLRAVVEERTAATISLGCTARLPGEPIAAVTDRADALLRQAKRTGKNRVVFAERLEPPRIPPTVSVRRVSDGHDPTMRGAA